MRVKVLKNIYKALNGVFFLEGRCCFLRCSMASLTCLLLFIFTYASAEPAEIIFIRRAAPTPHTQPASSHFLCILLYYCSCCCCDFYPGLELNMHAKLVPCVFSSRQASESHNIHIYNWRTSAGVSFVSLFLRDAVGEFSHKVRR